MNRKANRQAQMAPSVPKPHQNGAPEQSTGQPSAMVNAENLPKFWQHWWLPIALTFLCYSPNLLIGADDEEAWVYDDHSSVRRNPCVLGVDPMNKPVPWTCIFWADYWGTPMASNVSHKSYRPITTAFFIAEKTIWGFFDSRLWHLGNVATKAVATWLFGHLARRCLGCPESATYASLLFAVHPIHTESVSNITGQAETLSAVFMLLAFLAYARKTGRPAVNFAASVLAALAATLCKEPGFAALVVICVHIASLELRAVKAAKAAQRRDDADEVSDDGSQQNRLSWQDLRRVRSHVWVRLGGYCISGCLIFAGRCWVQGEKPQFNSFMNPGGFHHSRLARGLTMGHYAMTHARLLVAPVTLCPDYSNSAIPEVESLLDQRCLPMFAAAFGLAWAAIALVRAALDTRRDVHEVVTGAAWLVLPFLPVSNLFFTVGFAVAERVLFAPSIGLCLLAGLGVRLLAEALSRVSNDQTRPRLLAGLHKSLRCLLILLALRTALRDHDWNNSRSLWTSAYKSCPPNANVLGNLAISESDKPGFQRFLFERATAVGRPFSQDHSVDSLSQLLETMGHHREMLNLCQSYAHLGNPRITMCTAVAKQRLGMHSQALADYETLYSRMNDSNWHMSRIGRPDIVKGYVRSLALTGAELTASVIAQHEEAMPEPIRFHLWVSSALLSAQRNQTDAFAETIARLAKTPEAGPALTDLARELQDLGRHGDALTALSAIPPEARKAPVVAFYRQSAQDGLYSGSERCVAKELEMLQRLVDKDPPAAMETLADMVEDAVQTDLSDGDFTLLHVCRLIIQPVDAVQSRFGPATVGPPLMEVFRLFDGGKRGELTMHPKLMQEREKTDMLMKDLRQLARIVREEAPGGKDWGNWTMVPTEEFFAGFQA